MILDSAVEVLGALDVARRAVADAQDVAAQGFEPEPVVERGDPDDARRRDVRDLADASQGVFRQVAELGLQALQDRNDRVLRASLLLDDAIDDAIDDAEIGGAGVYFGPPIANRCFFPRM